MISNRFAFDLEKKSGLKWIFYGSENPEILLRYDWTTNEKGESRIDLLFENFSANRSVHRKKVKLKMFPATIMFWMISNIELNMKI